MPMPPNNPEFRATESLGRNASGTSIGPALQNAGNTLRGVGADMLDHLTRLKIEENKAKLLEDEGAIEQEVAGFYNWTLQNQDTSRWPERLNYTFDRVQEMLDGKGGSPALQRARSEMVMVKKNAETARMTARAGMLQTQQIKQTYMHGIDQAVENQDFGKAREINNMAGGVFGLPQQEEVESLIAGREQMAAYDPSLVATEDIQSRIDILKEKGESGYVYENSLDESERKGLIRGLERERLLRANTALEGIGAQVEQGKLKTVKEYQRALESTGALTVPEMERSVRSYKAQLEGAQGPSAKEKAMFEDRIDGLSGNYRNLPREEYEATRLEIQNDLLQMPSHPEYQRLLRMASGLAPEHQEARIEADAAANRQYHEKHLEEKMQDAREIFRTVIGDQGDGIEQLRVRNKTMERVQQALSRIPQPTWEDVYREVNRSIGEEESLDLLLLPPKGAMKDNE